MLITYRRIPTHRFSKQPLPFCKKKLLTKERKILTIFTLWNIFTPFFVLEQILTLSFIWTFSFCTFCSLLFFFSCNIHHFLMFFFFVHKKNVLVYFSHFSFYKQEIFFFLLQFFVSLFNLWAIKIMVKQNEEQIQYKIWRAPRLM